MARTGRPRAFDRDEAAEAALHLFCRYGYEATSLAQLKEAMGPISAASFYAAFNSKEALFREVLARYLATRGRAMAPLRDPSLRPRAAIEDALRASARMHTEASGPNGCLLVFAAMVGSAETAPVQAMLAAERRRIRAGLLACVARAVADGELTDGTDSTALAAVFEGALLGLSIQARDGVPFATLDASVTQLMTLWDARSLRSQARL